MAEIGGDLRATWGVLGEVLRGRSGKGGSVCRYFRQEGGGAVKDGGVIAGGPVISTVRWGQSWQPD